MAVERRIVTAQDFDRIAALPENAGRLLEFIGGEIVEVPSNPYSSKIGMRVGGRLMVFVEAHDLGHVTGEAGGYRVSGERYAPDAAFVSKTRQAELAEEGYNPIAPDLAVEVVSPSDDPEDLRIKIVNYLAAGTIVWVFYPKKRRIEVCAPGQPVRILGMDDVLDGGDLLPGFTLAVKDIFKD